MTVNPVSAALIGLFVPLAVSVLGAFTWRKLGRTIDLLSVAALAIGAVATGLGAISLGQSGETATASIPWLWFEGTGIVLNLGVHLDALGALMLFVVHALGLLVLVFSRWYLHDDRFYGKFFASFAFFIFAMSGVVVAPGLLQAFICWELVGLGSYFLIGYWHDKPEASDDPEYQAGKPYYATGLIESKLSPSSAQFKAFVVNRVGDFGFLSGLALCAWVVSSWTGFHGGDPLSWPTLFGAVAAGAFGHASFLGLSGTALLTLAGLLIFLGAMGKSAQFPLHVWLPDAMQGPTTASAIIHAATMVAAGVFLTARIYPMLTPEALTAIQWVGALTAFVAATIACVQWDFKAVLAYSTISQLGYMMIGLGSGAQAGGYGAGVSHLFTHAIFKCMLFLGAAAVIHALHGIQDLNRMGGLAKMMPLTALATGIGTLAILGVPGFSAFWSKDAILAAAAAKVSIVSVAGGCTFAALVPWILGLGTAGLTAFYMSRQWFLAFAGSGRDHHLVDHAHDPDRPSVIVLLILAFFSLQFVWTGTVNPASEHSWLSGLLSLPVGGLHPVAVEGLPEELAWHFHVQTMLASVVFLAIGVGAAWFLYVFQPARGERTAEWLRREAPTNLVWQFLANLWFIDKAYDFLFVEGLGRRGGKLVAQADLSPIISLDRTIDEAAGLSGWAGRFANFFQSGRSGMYAGWTLLALFGVLAMVLVYAK